MSIKSLVEFAALSAKVSGEELTSVAVTGFDSSIQKLIEIAKQNLAKLKK